MSGTKHRPGLLSIIDLVMESACFCWSGCALGGGLLLRERPVDLQWQHSRKWDNYNARRFSISLSLRKAPLFLPLHKHFIALWSPLAALFFPSSLCCCCLLVSLFASSSLALFLTLSLSSMSVCVCMYVSRSVAHPWLTRGMDVKDVVLLVSQT